MPTPDAPVGIDRRTFMGLCSTAGQVRGLRAALSASAATVVLSAQDTQAPTDFHRRHPKRFS